MRVGSLRSATLQCARSISNGRVWAGWGRWFEASYVPMVRRHARSGRRWRRDYLLAHLTCSIFGKVIETSTSANHRILLAIKNI
jgi:hypothetical protein